MSFVIRPASPPGTFNPPIPLSSQEGSSLLEWLKNHFVIDLNRQFLPSVYRSVVDLGNVTFAIRPYSKFDFKEFIIKLQNDVIELVNSKISQTLVDKIPESIRKNVLDLAKEKGIDSFERDNSKKDDVSIRVRLYGKDILAVLGYEYCLDAMKLFGVVDPKNLVSQKSFYQWINRNPKIASIFIELPRDVPIKELPEMKGWELTPRGQLSTRITYGNNKEFRCVIQHKGLMGDELCLDMTNLFLGKRFVPTLVPGVIATGFDAATLFFKALLGADVVYDEKYFINNKMVWEQEGSLIEEFDAVDEVYHNLLSDDSSNEPLVYDESHFLNSKKSKEGKPFYPVDIYDVAYNTSSVERESKVPFAVIPQAPRTYVPSVSSQLIKQAEQIVSGTRVTFDIEPKGYKKFELLEAIEKLSETNFNKAFAVAFQLCLGLLDICSVQEVESLWRMLISRFPENQLPDFYDNKISFSQNVALLECVALSSYLLGSNQVKSTSNCLRILCGDHPITFVHPYPSKRTLRTLFSQINEDNTFALEHLKKLSTLFLGNWHLPFVPPVENNELSASHLKHLAIWLLEQEFPELAYMGCIFAQYAFSNEYESQKELHCLYYKFGVFSRKNERPGVFIDDLFMQMFGGYPIEEGILIATELYRNGWLASDEVIVTGAELLKGGDRRALMQALQAKGTSSDLIEKVVAKVNKPRLYTVKKGSLKIFNPTKVQSYGKLTFQNAKAKEQYNDEEITNNCLAMLNLLEWQSKGKEQDVKYIFQGLLYLLQNKQFWVLNKDYQVRLVSLLVSFLSRFTRGEIAEKDFTEEQQNTFLDALTLFCEHTTCANASDLFRLTASKLFNREMDAQQLYSLFKTFDQAGFALTIISQLVTKNLMKLAEAVCEYEQDAQKARLYINMIGAYVSSDSEFFSDLKCLLLNKLEGHPEKRSVELNLLAQMLNLTLNDKAKIQVIQRITHHVETGSTISALKLWEKLLKRNWITFEVYEQKFTQFVSNVAESKNHLLIEALLDCFQKGIITSIPYSERSENWSKLIENYQPENTTHFQAWIDSGWFSEMAPQLIQSESGQIVLNSLCLKAISAFKDDPTYAWKLFVQLYPHLKGDEECIEKAINLCIDNCTITYSLEVCAKYLATKCQGKGLNEELTRLKKFVDKIRDLKLLEQLFPLLEEPLCRCYEKSPRDWAKYRPIRSKIGELIVTAFSGLGTAPDKFGNTLKKFQTYVIQLNSALQNLKGATRTAEQATHHSFIHAITPLYLAQVSEDKNLLEWYLKLKDYELFPSALKGTSSQKLRELARVILAQTKKQRKELIPDVKVLIDLMQDGALKAEQSYILLQLQAFDDNLSPHETELIEAILSGGEAVEKQIRNFVVDRLKKRFSKKIPCASLCILWNTALKANWISWDDWKAGVLSINSFFKGVETIFANESLPTEHHTEFKAFKSKLAIRLLQVAAKKSRCTLEEVHSAVQVWQHCKDKPETYSTLVTIHVKTGDQALIKKQYLDLLNDDFHPNIRFSKHWHTSLVTVLTHLTTFTAEDMLLIVNKIIEEDDWCESYLKNATTKSIVTLLTKVHALCRVSYVQETWQLFERLENELHIDKDKDCLLLGVDFFLEGNVDATDFDETYDVVLSIIEFGCKSQNPVIWHSKLRSFIDLIVTDVALLEEYCERLFTPLVKAVRHNPQNFNMHNYLIRLFAYDNDLLIQQGRDLLYELACDTHRNKISSRNKPSMNLEETKQCFDAYIKAIVWRNNTNDIESLLNWSQLEKENDDLRAYVFRETYIASEENHVNHVLRTIRLYNRSLKDLLDTIPEAIDTMFNYFEEQYGKKVEDFLEDVSSGIEDISDAEKKIELQKRFNDLCEKLQNANPDDDTLSLDDCEDEFEHIVRSSCRFKLKKAEHVILERMTYMAKGLDLFSYKGSTSSAFFSAIFESMNSSILSIHKSGIDNASGLIRGFIDSYMNLLRFKVQNNPQFFEILGSWLTQCVKVSKETPFAALELSTLILKLLQEDAIYKKLSNDYRYQIKVIVYSQLWSLTPNKSKYYLDYVMQCTRLIPRLHLSLYEKKGKDRRYCQMHYSLSLLLWQAPPKLNLNREVELAHIKSVLEHLAGFIHSIATNQASSYDDIEITTGMILNIFENCMDIVIQAHKTSEDEIYLQFETFIQRLSSTGWYMQVGAKTVVERLLDIVVKHSHLRPHQNSSFTPHMISILSYFGAVCCKTILPELDGDKFENTCVTIYKAYNILFEGPPLTKDQSISLLGGVELLLKTIHKVNRFPLMDDKYIHDLLYSGLKIALDKLRLVELVVLNEKFIKVLKDIDTSIGNRT